MFLDIVVAVNIIYIDRVVTVNIAKMVFPEIFVTVSIVMKLNVPLDIVVSINIVIEMDVFWRCCIGE